MLKSKKVKIKPEAVNKGSPQRADWIQQNLHKTFTTKKYESYMGTVYSLVEDNTNPKWLFFEEDLLEIKEE